MIVSLTDKLRSQAENARVCVFPYRSIRRASVWNCHSKTETSGTSHGVRPPPAAAPWVHGDASLEQGVVDVGDKRADVNQVELLSALTSAGLHV